MTSTTPSPSLGYSQLFFVPPGCSSVLGRVSAFAAVSARPRPRPCSLQSPPAMSVSPYPPDPPAAPPRPPSPTPTRAPVPKKLPGKWSVVAAASCVHALHATAVYMVPSTLLSPMRQAMGLSVAEITRPLIAYRVVQTIFLIPAGMLLDILGPQTLVRCSMTVAALTAPLLPLVTTLPQLMALQIVFSITKLFGGLSALLVIISSAFPNQNGLATATGILLSGYSFAGFLAPAVIGSLSRRFGWRASSMILSLLFAVVSLPLTYHFLREHPTSPPRPPFFQNALKQMKARLRPQPHSPLENPKIIRPLLPLRRPSRPSSPSRSSRSQEAPHPERLDASLASDKRPDPLFPPSFVLIAITVFALSLSLHVIFDHFLLFLSEDFGLPFERATLFMSAFNLIALASKLAIGPLADRFNKSVLLAIFGAIAGFGSLLLLDVSAVAFHTTTSVTKLMVFVLLCTSSPISGLMVLCLGHHFPFLSS